MQLFNHIYTFIYDDFENDLCKLESKAIFNKFDTNKFLFSNTKVNPSISAFIRKRLDIVLSADNYKDFINKVKAKEIEIEEFKVEYIVLQGDTTPYKERLSKLRDVGYNINGIPDYYKPKTTYGICYNKGVWYMGILIKNKFEWQKHNKKPFSYSNSLTINIAKALVNIASQGNKKSKLLDTCCGVGTIMLEACYAGYQIEGCDINWKVCRQSRANLAHFNYEANVYRSDIKDITSKYDAAIIDLPYNIYSSADEESTFHIIHSASIVSPKLIIVSTIDITELIKKANLNLINHCEVSKSGKTNFSRKVWVCEKI